MLFLRRVIRTDANRWLDFSSKCTEMRLAVGLRPDVLGVLTALPQTTKLDSRGTTSKGKGGGMWPILYPDLGDRSPSSCSLTCYTVIMAMWCRSSIIFLMFAELVVRCSQCRQTASLDTVLNSADFLQFDINTFVYSQIIKSLHIHVLVTVPDITCI